MQKFLRTLMLTAVMLLPFVSQAQTCEPISTFPVTYGFEESEGFTTTVTSASACTTNVFSTCWRNEQTTFYGSTGSGRIWHIYGGTTASQIHSGAHSLMLPDKGSSSAGVSTTMLTFPAMSFTSAGGYVVSFWIYRSGTSSNPEGFKMYVSNTDTIDANAVELGHYSRNRSIAYPVVESTSGWYQYETAPITMTGTVYLIFEGQSYYGSSTYIDDIVISEAPSCFKVTNLAIDAVTVNSITLSWNDTLNTGATYTIYDMSDTSVVASGVTSTTYTITGLTANTLYSYAVMTDCGAGDVTDLTVPVSGRTECAAFATPYTWDFEDMNTGAAPLCWTKLTGGSANVSSGSGATYYHSATKYIQFSGVAGNNIIALPQTEDEISTLQLRFWTRPESTTNASCGTFSVGYMTDVTDATTFVAVATYTYSDFTAYEEKMVTFTGAPTGARMAMRHDATSSSWYWRVDDVTIEDAPSCLPVSTFSASNITDNSVTLTWSDAGNTGATYALYDMSDTSVIASAINALTYTVTGLAANTQYTFGVQAVCSDGNAPMITVGARTACAAEALPFAEAFDATLANDLCWSGASNITADSALNGGVLTLTANNSWTYSSSTSNGLAAGHYRVNIYGTSCKKWMITPIIDLTTATSPLLTFDAAFTAYSGTAVATGFESNASQVFMVLVSTDNCQTWSLASNVSLTSIASTTYLPQYVDLSAYAGQAVRVAFYAQSTVSGGDNNLHIDNISIDESVAEICYPVTGLAASNITSSGVTLSWNGTAAGNYSVYDMSDPSVAMFTVTDTTVSPAALAPNTQYTFGVVANCTSGSSDTVTVTIRTACDAVVIPFTEGFEATSATVGCWSTDGPGNWTIGTGDYSSTTGAFEGSLNAKITHGTTGDATKLISPVLDLGTADGLQLTFAHIQRSWAGDIDELRVYTRASATAAWDTVAEYTDAVATWTVETLNLTGTIYQVAFEMTDSYGYGVGIDSVVFNLPPACMPVTNLAVDSATATSVFLSWNGTAAAYNIYSATGDVVATGVTTTNYEVTGLTAMTAYTFGVTAVCGTTESPVTIVNAVTACAGETCNITIAGVDSYGDGWNDNTINIMQAGAVIGTFTLASGSSATETFTVCSSAPVSFSWVLGSFPGEASFEILDGGNASVYTCTSGANLTDGVVFYTLTDACPSCLPAANLTVDTADLTSITISWTGSAASYDVYNGATMVANVTTNTYTFTGLTAATGYTFGVQAICSATDTASMATIDAMTACGDITTLPYAEGFENGLGCWTTVNGSADGMPWNVVDDASYAHSGAGAAVSFSYYSTSIHADAWLISPKFVLPTIAAGDTLNLGWWHKVHNMYPTELYDVMLSTTTNDTAAFTTTLLAVSPDSVSDYVQKVVDLSAYAGQSVYIAFHHHDSYDQYYLFIDDITMSVGAAPAPVPDSMLVNVAVNDATLGTTVPAPGAHYFYEGDTVSVIAVPGTGNHLESWTISIVYAGYGTVADTTITTGTTDVFDLFGGWVVEHGHNAYTFNVTANFATGVDSMMVTVAVNDATMGTTIPAPGVHYFVDGEAASVVAVPNDGYHLEGWTIQCQVAGFGTVLDTTLNMAMPDVFDLFGGWIVEWGDAMYAWNVTANFAVGEAPVMHDSVTVITSVNDATMGTITPAPGTHYYVEGDTVEFNIQANPGYYVYALQYTATYPMFGVIESETLTDSAEIAEFIAEMTEEPLVVEAEMYGLTVSINVIFAAEGTAPNIYHVTVGYDVSRGTVTGADDYIEGSNVTLTAIAYNGYEFVAWVENGDTVGRQSVYTIDNIDADHHLTAVFGVSTQGIADVDMENVKIYSTENVIVVRGAEGKPVVLFDVNGRQLGREACAAERVEFRVNNSGVYLVKVANAAAKRVVVVR